MSEPTEPSEPTSRRSDRAAQQGADGGGIADCDQAIVEIYQYLDGELTVWKRTAITRHLDDCPPCAQGFSFEIELRQVIATKCRERVPPELKRRIAEALGIEPPS